MWGRWVGAGEGYGELKTEYGMDRINSTYREARGGCKFKGDLACYEDYAVLACCRSLPRGSRMVQDDISIDMGYTFSVDSSRQGRTRTGVIQKFIAHHLV